MIPSKRKEVYTKAIRIYGEEHQVHKAIEEMAELTVELCKHLACEGDWSHLIEELADVMVTAEQLCLIFDRPGTAVTSVMEAKIKRLQERMRDADS